MQYLQIEQTRQKRDCPCYHPDSLLLCHDVGSWFVWLMLVDLMDGDGFGGKIFGGK
jgi:hypothetical protein